jgi:hypothetical protein
MIILGIVFFAVAGLLGWLIVTERWRFPLLFDFGLALLVLGILANGYHLLNDSDANLRAWVVAGVGAALMLISYARETMRGSRQDRLQSINRQIMRGRR